LLQNLYITKFYKMNYVFSILIIIICLVWGFFLFKKLKILDKPGPDITDRKRGVPTMLGIFVYIAFWAVVLLVFPEFLHQRLFWGLAIGWSLVILIELLDELYYLWRSKLKIPLLVRLLFHIGAAVVAVYIGNFSLQEWSFGSLIITIPKWAFVIIFAVRTIICIHAINRFDGIHAQASGVSSIGFLTILLLIKFVVLKYYPNISADHAQILLMTQNLAFVLLGISLLSTVIEFKPLGLMRDVGTMFFGFSLAYLSMVGGTKVGTLLVVLSLVIFDALWVWIHRLIILKKNPIKWDYNHLHYRLLRLGRKKWEARVFVRVFSLVMMVLMLLQGGNRVNKLVILIMMAVIFFGVNAYLFWIKKLPCGLDKKKIS